MAQENNTFVEELQKLLKNLQPLKYMPGAEGQFDWVLMELERPIIQKLQELHGVGGQFPGQQPGTGMGATGPTPGPTPPGMPSGLPPELQQAMMGAGAGPSPMPGPPPNMNAQIALPPTSPDMLANLRGGAQGG